jgi:hypothetical protein
MYNFYVTPKIQRKINGKQDDEVFINLAFFVKSTIELLDVIFTFMYSVEITYGTNSAISKPMTFVKNAETGRFLFLTVPILSRLTRS